MGEERIISVVYTVWDAHSYMSLGGDGGGQGICTMYMLGDAQSHTPQVGNAEKRISAMYTVGDIWSHMCPSGILGGE